MNRKHSRAAVALVIALMAPLWLAACGAATSQVAFDDPTITTRVKTALINDPVVGPARNDVETLKGVVTLSGRVKSKDDEAKALALARTIKGVTEVKSSLQIQP